MIIDRDTIRYIAKLAKLRFTETETDQLAIEFGMIFSHFENVAKEDLSGFCLSIKSGDSVLRSDETDVFDNKEQLFQNARRMKDGSIVIPKVME